MKNVLVVGGGLVGRHIATDLSNSFNVTCIDRDESLVEFFKDTKVKFEQMEISGSFSAIGAAVSCHSPDFAVNALPGFLGFKALEKLIEKRN